MKGTYAANNAKRMMEKMAHRRKLEELHGLTDHPKSEMLYHMAWEYGHASGWYEVENYYDDFAPLLKEK